MIYGFVCMILSIHLLGIKSQFRPGFTPAILSPLDRRSAATIIPSARDGRLPAAIIPSWDQRSSAAGFPFREGRSGHAVNPLWDDRLRPQSISPAHHVADIINSQPLALSEQQGQQLINQITHQVLQTMGSTAQLRNFNSPSGFDQRFNSFQPEQFLPREVAPVGFIDAQVHRTQNSAILHDNMNGRNNLEHTFPNPHLLGGPTSSQFPAEDLHDPTQRHSIFPSNSENHLHVSNDGFVNAHSSVHEHPHNKLINFENALSPKYVMQKSQFPDAIPLNSSIIHVKPGIHNPLGMAIHAREHEILHINGVHDGSLLLAKPDTNDVEHLIKENRKLKDLLLEKGKKKSNDDKKQQTASKPPAQNNLGKGLILGALGALFLG